MKLAIFLVSHILAKITERNYWFVPTQRKEASNETNLYMVLVGADPLLLAVWEPNWSFPCRSGLARLPSNLHIRLYFAHETSLNSYYFVLENPVL